MGHATRRWPPGFVLLASFLGMSLVGALLLSLPVSQAGPGLVSWFDAWFTAVSAVCVTGLIVVDTASAYSPFGHWVILVLIQLGGIGIMTFFYFVVMALTGGVSLVGRSTLADVFAQQQFVSAKRLFLGITSVTLLIELLGALMLYGVLRDASGEATWFVCLFHAVSAFCNAGFSTLPDSLVSYQSSFRVQGVLGTLIVLGGLGYTVVFALFGSLRRRTYRTHLLSLHSRLVLWVTGVLILGGAAAIALLEWNHEGTLKGLSWPGKCIASCFQSVTTRTAGFNSLDFAEMHTSTLMIVMALMFVGGSPGSCAGGVKTTSFALFLVTIHQRIRGEERITMRHREVPISIVRRTFALLAVSTLVLLLGAFLLSVSLDLSGSELGEDMRATVFQSLSALATVGLSVWTTEQMGQLPAVSKFLLIVLMFVGRVGPLSVVSSVFRERSGLSLRYPEESVLIG